MKGGRVYPEIMGKEKKKGFFAQFRDFIAKGNVLDMAIGVVIGAAFKDIVTALVNNIINPLIGLVCDTSSLDQLSYTLKSAVIKTGIDGKPVLDADGVPIIDKEAVLLNYGSFIKSIIDFLIVAFCLFCALKVVMGIKERAEKMKKKEEEEKVEAEAPAAPKPEEVTAETLKEILAILKEQKGGKEE